MNDELRRDLLALAELDRVTRARLAADGALFGGYHPEMRAVHEQNAEALSDILDQHGWPTAAQAGEDGAEAAWLVAQHAISLPDFMRRCLALLQAAVKAGQAPGWRAAMMLDRIRVFEGAPQLFGTQFDWDEEGRMSPAPIAEPDAVDERRAEVGLPPLSQSIAEHRRRAEGEPAPQDLAKRAREAAKWARSVGWRAK